ncbi:phosphonate ABC transporter, partial [Pseudoalteromonas spongiae]
ITVRDSLHRLLAEGLFYCQKGRGRYVTPMQLKWRPATKVNFYHLAQEQGFTRNTRVLRILNHEFVSLNQH